MEPIDAGTITEQSTDDVPAGSSGSSGPSGALWLDDGTITSVNTDSFSTVGPTPPRWPSQDL